VKSDGAVFGGVVVEEGSGLKKPDNRFVGVLRKLSHTKLGLRVLGCEQKYGEVLAAI